MNRGMQYYLALAMAVALATGPSCQKHVRLDTSPALPAPGWDAVFDRASGWNGGDVAASFAITGGRVLWVFGDSFVGEVNDGRRGGNAFINNAIAVHPLGDRRPPRADAVDFIWGETAPDGKPAAWITPSPAGPERQWYWPTGGGIVYEQSPGDPALALFLIRLSKAPGADSVWAFHITGNELAVVDNVEDPPRQWTQRTVPLASGAGDTLVPPEIEWGIAALAVKGFIYVFGVQAHDLVLARVPEPDLETFTRWSFYEDEHTWSPSPADADTIAANLPTEFTVNPISSSWRSTQYLMVYSEPGLGDEILIRTAPHPEGPWSGPRPIYRVNELESNPARFTYAAKAHPEISPAGRLLVSYIVNSNDLADLANASIYRPRFFSISIKEVQPCLSGPRSW